jgi:uncharacterized GH25 family protein
MKRKLVGGIAVLIVAVLAWVVFHHRGDHAKTSATSSTANRADQPIKVPHRSAASPEWSRDVDPEGPLRLEGQVLDEGGAGIGGATVWLSSEPPRSTRTDSDGSFAFDKVVGREYTLTAVAGERVGGPVMYRLTATSDPVVIRTSAGAKVAVDVKDDAGAPVANATVKLSGLDVTKSTAADGTALLSPVHPGWVGVEVTADGYAPTSAFGQVGSAGATGTIHVKLHKGVSVSGRVVDETGKGIAKAHITVADSPWWPTMAGEATSDDKGDFTIAAIAAGTHTLHAEDGEHAPAPSIPVTVADRAVTGVTITMKEGGVIRGIVVDTKGAGVGYATIRVAPNGSNNMFSPGREAVADNKGTFEVRGIARAKMQVRASSDDASSKLLDLDLSSQAVAKDVRLVLDQTGTIAGVVVDGDGKPVPEIQVTAMADVFAGDGTSLAGMSTATTDGAGAFTVRGLPDGSYRLHAMRGSSSMRGWEAQGVAAKPGDKNVKLVLPAPAVLVGKIALAGGQPPALANVQLGYHPSTPAGPDGAFRVEDLEPGKYDVRILGPEFAQLTKRDVELTAGKTTDLGTITVARGRKLTGRVIDPSGAPVAGARVTVSTRLLSMEGAGDQMSQIEEMTGARIATTDQDGDFTIIGIPKTHMFAGAEQADKGRATPVDIAEGDDDPQPVTLQLHGFGSIMGKVTSQGQPAVGVTITDTIKGSLAQVAIARTAEDGTFTLAKVAEGTHVLNAMQVQGFGAGGMSSTSATVDVVAGKQSTVTIDIPVGNVTVTVTIAPLAGAKVDAAQVFLFRGPVTATNAKQLNDTFGAGGMQGMKFWFGTGKPMPEFDQIVPADYSVCGIPITGNMMDPTFQQRLQEHVDLLRVYCKPAHIAASPDKQGLTLELPAMTPLPDPKP